MKYETRCIKIKLNPDSIEKVREWAQGINHRKDEAIATLQDESIVLEAVFLDRTGKGDFLICLMKAASFEKAREAVQKSIHSINKYHQNFKRENWEDSKNLELIIDLDRISEIK